MGHRKAKRIRKVMFAEGIVISDHRYRVEGKKIVTTPGRRMYRREKRQELCICDKPLNILVADRCERCHRPLTNRDPVSWRKRRRALRRIKK